ATHRLRLGPRRRAVPPSPPPQRVARPRDQDAGGAVTLLEPAALLALLAVIVVAAVYVVRLPFRRRDAITLPTTAALATVAPRRPGWQRHASTVLFLAAIATTVVAFARPAQQHTEPKHLGSLIVALDTSNSMRATDVRPQRLEAAQRAALAF